MIATKLLLIGLTEVRREGIHAVKNTVKNDGMLIDFAENHRKQKTPKSLPGLGVSVISELCGIIVWRRGWDSNPRSRF